MAIMDDHVYQPTHTQQLHYSNFGDHFQSYSTPSSTHSSPPTYPVNLPYSHASSHMPTEYQQNQDFHQMRPQHPLHRHSYSGQTLHVMTEGPIDHDPLDYTAHPSRPHTHYQFHLNGHQDQSSRRDDDENSVQSYDRSGEILPVCNGFNRPLNHHEQERIAHLDKLKFFLATAPSRWDSTNSSDVDGAMVSAVSDPSNSMSAPGQPPSSHPALNRFLLPTSEYVSCVLWNGLYHITGTDIVRALVFRFEAFGRPVRNMKKFEEGIFSDLRNLKPGVDACLEEPKSPFLDLLFKYQCIRTQKKQKVFYWFSVPHDRLFLDALERDLKREKMGLEPTTVITGEPAMSFTYDSKKSLYEQFSKASGGKEGEGELEAAVRRADEAAGVSCGVGGVDGYATTAGASRKSSMDDMILVKGNGEEESVNKLPPALQGPNTAFYSMFSLFEGSPTYKQRRKKLARASRKASGQDGRSDGEDYQRRGESVIDMGVGYGPTDSAMSAADMFVAQAKGELGPANLGEREKERQRKEITVTPASAFSDMQHQVTLQHPSAVVRSSQGLDIDSIMHPPQLLSRPQEHRNNTFPMASTSQNPYPHLGPRPHALSFPVPSSSDLGPSSGMETPQGKTKVFVCPLYSCCRFFKRMEHLKRHLRTHTLERPYQCKRCNKRFSRSDNLNQHLRTHTRADSEGGNTSGYDDEQADIESEGMDELDGDEGYNTRVYPNGVRNLQTPDIKMCEMEVSGNVQEIHGDEEGLVAAPGADFVNGGQEAYYAPHLDPYGNAQLPSGAQWTGAMNGPSPHIQMTQAPRSNTPSSGYLRQSPAVYGSDSEYVTSISAPSHKQMFDHSSLYPPHLGIMESSSGPGPIRRHRSMTPSLIRGENVRRPMTTSTDFGSPGRGYHPYAIPISGYVSQSSTSTQSSPASYHVPLDYTSSQAASIGSVSRSESTHRSTSNGQQLQDQMHQMLNLDQTDDSIFANTTASSSGQQTYDEMYRTESPLPFAGVAPSGHGSQFNKHMAGHDQSMYTPLPETQADQFVSHTVDAGYYSSLSQPHHSM